MIKVLDTLRQKERQTMNNDTLFYADQDKWMALSKQVARKIITLYGVPSKEHDDVYSNANIGLLKAIRQFDPDKHEQKHVVPHLHRTIFNKAISEHHSTHGMPNSGKDKVRKKMFLSTFPYYNDSVLVPTALLVRDTPPREEVDFRDGLESMDCLSEKQIDILTMFFYHDMSMVEIGKQFGVTRIRVHQIISEAKSLLKEAGYETVLERLML
jgi:RNA polymerase sigma factor (sigma-70 family)